MPFQHLAVDKSMADWWMSYKLLYIYIFASFVDGCASVNASFSAESPMGDSCTNLFGQQ